jgi:histone H3/H4
MSQIIQDIQVRGFSSIFVLPLNYVLPENYCDVFSFDEIIPVLNGEEPKFPELNKIIVSKMNQELVFSWNHSGIFKEQAIPVDHFSVQDMSILLAKRSTDSQLIRSVVRLLNCCIIDPDVLIVKVWKSNMLWLWTHDGETLHYQFFSIASLEKTLAEFILSSPFAQRRDLPNLMLLKILNLIKVEEVENVLPSKTMIHLLNTNDLSRLFNRHLSFRVRNLCYEIIQGMIEEFIDIKEPTFEYLITIAYLAKVKNAILFETLIRSFLQRICGENIFNCHQLHALAKAIRLVDYRFLNESLLMECIEGIIDRISIENLSLNSQFSVNVLKSMNTLLFALLETLPIITNTNMKVIEEKLNNLQIYQDSLNESLRMYALQVVMRIPLEPSKRMNVKNLLQNRLSIEEIYPSIKSFYTKENRGKAEEWFEHIQVIQFLIRQFHVRDAFKYLAILEEKYYSGNTQKNLLLEVKPFPKEFIALLVDFMKVLI